MSWLRKCRSHTIVCMIFAMLVASTLLTPVSPVDGATLHRTIVVRQDGRGNYRTIQAAADAAQPGDTVLIYGGTYRESVTVPPKQTTATEPITFEGAPGQRPIISGSDVATGWTSIGNGVWRLVKANTYFGSFNPFATDWPTTTLPNSEKLRTCGGVFVGSTMLGQQALMSTVLMTSNTWTSQVNQNTTTIWANFDGHDPNRGHAEITKRKMDFTAAWNQSYIHVEGLEITRASAPQDQNYWRPGALPADGALSTNGGYRWVIRQDVFTQNSGIALDFGMGSMRVVDLHGGFLPKNFGSHVIDDNVFIDNGTDGAFAWKAPFVTVRDNRFIDDNLFNVQLGSEAYLKVVDESPGIRFIHNYFFNSQRYFTPAMWLDSQVQDSTVSQNVLVDTGGVVYEADLANNLFDNNILLNHFEPSAAAFGGSPSGGIEILESSSVYVVDNLFVDQARVDISNVRAAGSSQEVEHYDGVARSVYLFKPGTLTSLGLWRVRIQQNVISNNLFYDRGMTNVLFTQPSTYDPVALQSGSLVQYMANRFWDNRVDFNVYYNGAQKVNDFDPSLGPDEHSATVPGRNTASYRCTPDRCVVFMQINRRNTPMRIGAPAITSGYLGSSKLLPGDFPPAVTTDFGGRRRSPVGVAVGPFAMTHEGRQVVQVWP